MTATTTSANATETQWAFEAEWHGQRLWFSSADKACATHEIEQIPDEYNRPTGFLWCRNCLGMADEPDAA